MSTWLKEEELERLRSIVSSKGKLEEPKSPWESFRFHIKGYTGIVYTSGKVVYHEPLAFIIEEALIEKEMEVGSDEAGKGEKTGPVVVASVALDPIARKRLRSRGLLESKSTPQDRLEELVALIKRLAKAYEVRIIYPDELSLVWKRGNLNELLARWHFEVISSVLSKVKASRIIIDSFDKKELERIFSPLSDKIEVVIEPKADEKYAVVAAASLLAKLSYIKNERKGIKWST